MRPPSLRVRLTLWFSASILLILLPVVSGLALLQWRAMREALDHHLQEDVEFALQMLVVRNDVLVWRVDDDRDPGYDAGPRRWVEVYRRDGSVAYVRGIPEAAAIQRSLPDVRLSTTGADTIATPFGARVRVMVTDRTIGGTPYRIRAARSEDPLRADLRGLLLLYGAFSVLAVALASGAGYIISGRALAPLGAMAARARAISAERLSERLPVTHPDDELGMLATVFNDTFARLEASFERLRRFTADVSHELRTPLTAIRSVGEVGLTKARTPADYEETIGSMLEEVDRLSRMVESLLTLSRWESGRSLPQRSPVDLWDLASQVCNQLTVLADERDASLVLAPGHGPIVEGDGLMLRQALTNVVDNAIKYTPSGGAIRVRVDHDETAATITVEDDGPGIPEEFRTRVTERFFRLDRERMTHPDVGAGLGLSIAHWVMMAHRGHLDFDDSSSGGTRVRLVLPLA